MRVGVYPAGRDACAFYRLLEPARVLAAQGADVVLEPPLLARWHDTVTGKRVVDMDCPSVDVLVMQRPLHRKYTDAIPLLQAQGVAVVVDLDDDFQTISPDNPAWRTSHPSDPEHNWRNVARACALADLLTVSTPALAERYGRHGRVAVLPNLVPARYLDVARLAGEDQGAATSSPVVGWTGTPKFHRGDLEVAGDAVRRALEASGARFLAIGSPETLAVLGVAGEVAPWTPLTDGYPELVASLDVGIAPLRDTRFNVGGKSWLKAIEYAALGVACVMSPSEDYLRLARLGVGEIARRPREWEGILRRLLTDHLWRQERSAAGREALRALTYEANAERWLEAWQSAATRRRPVPA